MQLKLILLCFVIWQCEAITVDKHSRVKAIVTQVFNKCKAPHYIENKWGTNLVKITKFRSFYTSLCILDETDDLFIDRTLNIQVIKQIIPLQYISTAFECRVAKGVANAEAVRRFTNCYLTTILNREYAKIDDKTQAVMNAYAPTEADVVKMLNDAQVRHLVHFK